MKKMNYFLHYYSEIFNFNSLNCFKFNLFPLILGFDSLGNPSSRCYGKNYAFVRSMHRPFCSDNNYSLNSLTPCYDASTGESAVLHTCVRA